jgi:hypothetical protein
MKFKDEDKLCIQPYLILMDRFVHSQIDALEFEKKFLEMRRNDGHWMGGSLDNRLGEVLDNFFLDVDEYAPPELFSQELGDIDEAELRACASRTIDKLVKLIS